MILSSYLEHLKKLDELEMEIYRMSPGPPIGYTYDPAYEANKKRIEAMDEQRKLIIATMADSFGLQTRQTSPYGLVSNHWNDGQFHWVEIAGKRYKLLLDEGEIK